MRNFLNKIAHTPFALSLAGLRSAVQHISFFILTYGRHFGVNLGNSLPCFSCPYVLGCGGVCYFRRLQTDMLIPLADIVSGQRSDAIYAFLTMLVLLMIFGKSWCGWICPMGLAQEWVTKIRSFFGIREATISHNTMKRLGIIKYVILGYFVVLVPALFHLGYGHVDLHRAICDICPAKTIMPFFSLDTRSWVITTINPVTFTVSSILILFTGISLVGIFFKDRFFCIFCPMAAMMHIFKPLLLLRLVKTPSACHGCGNCRRGCAMGLEETFKERTRTEVQADGCTGCFSCVGTCAGDTSLSIKFGRFTLFSSSRNYASGIHRLVTLNPFALKKKTTGVLTPATISPHTDSKPNNPTSGDA